MSPIKIIFFDIDGTLVDPNTRQISLKTKEALKRLHEAGILLCVATGRPSASLPDFGDLHFDAYCAFNGSLSYTHDTIIHSEAIPKKDVSTVLTNANAIGRPISIATKDCLAANGFDKDLADYYQLAGLTLTVAPEFDEVCQHDIYQILLGCRESDHADILRNTSGVKIAISWDRAVDVIPVNSGKGASISKILSYFHLTSSQALAFGDSYNDLDMLQAVGTGVAMGNAADALKVVADDVCGPVSEDGIFHYCVQHGLL